MKTLGEYGYTAINIEVSGRCNFKCKYCMMRLRDTSGYIPTDAIAAIVDQIKRLGGESLEHIYFNALGEPLTHPDVCGLLRMAKEKSLPLTLITNGVVLILLCRPVAFFQLGLRARVR